MERRDFIKKSAATSSLTILSPKIAFGTQANSEVRMGIIGCGNRGTGVITNMVKETNSRIVAMADLFEDRLLEKKEIYNNANDEKGAAKIDKSKMHQGSEAYLKLIEDPDVDAVLISSPAYTHPGFMDAAVSAGKHVYCEKPVATDVEGCKRIEQIGKEANGNVSIVIGFQIRYASPYVEMVKRIQRGDIGELVNVQLYYFGREKAEQATIGNSFDEFRIRNHYHYRALSGGILLDQGIHMIDVANWVLQQNPLQAVGAGSRKGGLDFGDTYTNYQVIYDYPDDVLLSIHTKKFGSYGGDVCARFIGTTGSAEAHYNRGVYITGDNAWDSGFSHTGKPPTEAQRAAGIFTSSLHDSNANKVKSFIDSIETGKHLDETASGTASTLTAILGVNAAMAKETITWDEMLYSNDRANHNLDLGQFDR